MANASGFDCEKFERAFKTFGNLLLYVASLQERYGDAAHTRVDHVFELNDYIKARTAEELQDIRAMIGFVAGLGPAWEMIVEMEQIRRMLAEASAGG